jgi:hypothetical protein
MQTLTGAFQEGDGVMTKAHEERVYARFEDVPWATWHPQERATLLFVIRAGQMLRTIGSGCRSCWQGSNSRARYFSMAMSSWGIT